MTDATQPAARYWLITYRYYGREQQLTIATHPTTWFSANRSDSNKLSLLASLPISAEQYELLKTELG